MCDALIRRDKQSIEFRDTNDLSRIIYTHSVAPHRPEHLCTVGSSFLLYEDESKNPCDIHWLDCNGSMPKLLTEKSFTASLQVLWDMIGVRNSTDEQVVGIQGISGIHCYSTATKSLKWSVEGKLPEMREALYPVGLATDGRGHLFISDGQQANKCIQMFSVSDGQYLGCLIKKGEQGLGCPNGICWHSASHSLVVAHGVGGFWSLSMINIEY